MNEYEKHAIGISDAISKLRPNATYEMVNTVFTKWHDTDGLPAPEWSEVMEQLEKDQIEFARNKYARDRKSEYPSVGDQLDMIWHALNSGGEIKNSEWFNLIRDIKQKYPKP